MAIFANLNLVNNGERLEMIFTAAPEVNKLDFSLFFDDLGFIKGRVGIMTSCECKTKNKSNLNRVIWRESRTMTEEAAKKKFKEK